MHHADSHYHLSKYQHHFRQALLNNIKQADMAIMNFGKTFEKLSHLRETRRNIDINDCLLQWIDVVQ